MQENQPRYAGIVRSLQKLLGASGIMLVVVKPGNNIVVNWTLTDDTIFQMPLALKRAELEIRFRAAELLIKDLDNLKNNAAGAPREPQGT